jgi:hypothetical protein
LLRKSEPIRGLVVAPYGIVPAHDGSKAHTEAHIRQLKDLGHEVWYLGLGLPSDEAAAMRNAWQGRFVHAPFLRWNLRRPHWKAVWNFVCKNIRERFGQQPHVDTWYQAQWTDVASELANRVRFDYVLVHYIFITQVFKAFPSNVRRIIDTHDSCANLIQRLAAKGVVGRRWSCSSRGEAMALRRGEYIVANQPAEGKIFKDCLGAHAKVVTVGHSCDWQPLPEAPNTSIGFLASGNPMNQTGLTWFMKECWPLIRSALPQARLLLAGPICDTHGAWLDASGVKLLGRVAHIRNFHEQTTIEINPVSAGAGLKIKTMESLAFGRAVVSVTEGVAGLSRDYGAFIVAETTEAFAGAIVRLLKDQSARAALVARAERLISDWNNRQRSALASLFAGL